ncbi:hypothetical protein J2T57_003862 [Natronocella acetinitrilica]|uniref:Uncharacterized protein n=2 Tax=Natronocella acetinitrilica TaxID=414046 RepID=A0AAE3G8E6_9GAMM|nr:hypothetical protein [Natronocella acetinitrilica]
MAEPGAPGANADCTRQVVDGVAVYLPRALQIEEAIIIRLQGFFGMKRLFVEGVGLSAGKEK